MTTAASGDSSCTVQVNVTDRDLPVIRHTIPHHLRSLGSFDRYLVSINRHTTPPDGGVALDRFLDDIANDPRVDVAEIDYSSAATEWVSEKLFGGDRYPLFDWKGTPIHGLVEPLRNVRTTHMLHLDSDMLIGGNACHWIEDATAALAADDRIIAASPLAGPPGGARYLAGGTPLLVNGADAHRVRGISQRICLLAVATMFDVVAPIPLIEPTRLSHRLRGRARNGQAVEYLERSINTRLVELDRFRLDLLGRVDGGWSLHLPLKPPEVIDQLPEIIHRIERNDVPDGQRGDYNLNSSMCAASRLPNRVDRLRGIQRDVGTFVRSRGT